MVAVSEADSAPSSPSSWNVGWGFVQVIIEFQPHSAPHEKLGRRRRRRIKKKESSGVCRSAPPSLGTHLQLIAERQIAFALATASHLPQPEVKLNIHRAKEADLGPISPLRRSRNRHPCSAKCGREPSVYPPRWLINSGAFPGRRSQM